MATIKSAYISAKGQTKKSLSRVLLVAAAAVLLAPALSYASSGTGSLPFTDPDSSSMDVFGQDISLTSDGSTALVTAPGTVDSGGDQGAGAAYIYQSSGGVWTTSPVISLLPDANGTGANVSFGSSGAISADGTEVVIGAPGALNPYGVQTGAAYIYNEPSGGWGSAGDTLTPSAVLYGDNSSSGDLFGASSSLSSNGSTIVIGAVDHIFQDGDQSGYGEAYAFSEPNGGWSGTLDQPTELQPIYNNTFLSEPNAEFGFSSSVSGDSSTVFVSAPFGGSNTSEGINGGFVAEYQEPVGGWSSESSATANDFITPSDPTNGGDFGDAIGQSTNTSTVVIGSPTHNNPSNSTVFQGSAYLYTNSGTGLTFDEELNAGTNMQTADEFGVSSAVSPNGTTFLVGYPGYTDPSSGNTYVGEAYQYTISTKAGVTTASTPNIIPAPSNAANQDFGYATAVTNNSAEGNVFIGAPGLTGAQSSSSDANIKALIKGKSLDAGTNSSSSSVGAAYLYDTSAPQITGFGTSNVGAGQSLTIYGQHFLPALQQSGSGLSVTFAGGETANVSYATDTELVVTVPNYAKTGNVTVSNSNGTTKANYTVGPELYSLSSSGSSEGASMVLKGYNLSGATSASLNGESMEITSDKSGSMTVTVPNDAYNSGSNYITVNFSDGAQATTPNQLLVNNPTIVKATTSANTGQTITIGGYGMSGVTEVTFTTSSGTVNVAPSSIVSTKKLQVVVPSNAVSGNVTVMSPAGLSNAVGITIKN